MTAGRRHGGINQPQNMKLEAYEYIFGEYWWWWWWLQTSLSGGWWIVISERIPQARADGRNHRYSSYQRLFFEYLHIFVSACNDGSLHRDITRPLYRFVKGS